MINLNQKLLGFTNNNSKNNSTLHIVKNFEELSKINILTKEQENFYLKKFINKQNNEIHVLPNFNNGILLAFSFVCPSKIPRKSTIDQAAKIGKLIVFANTRELALSRLKRALDELIIDGIETTSDLFKSILKDEEFLSGDYNIHWLENWLNQEKK